jgi:hypothetical protein
VQNDRELPGDGNLGQVSPIDNNHAPIATKTTPPKAAIRRPKEVVFSNKTSSESRTIQSRFVTPNNSTISAQQQPTQYAPWRSPSRRQPGTSRRKPPCCITNANGIWHWVRHMSLRQVH